MGENITDEDIEACVQDAKPESAIELVLSLAEGIKVLRDSLSETLAEAETMITAIETKYNIKRKAKKDG